MITQPLDTTNMTVTEAAARKAGELLGNAQKETAAIRVYVKSGGLQRLLIWYGDRRPRTRG